MKEYEVVIGLEIHAELDINTKIFCSCKKSFGESPNSNACPVCVGFPGTLPILNKRAVEQTIMAGLVVGSRINEKAIFERKNYFYPDLGKAYQISQLEEPICIGGGITLSSGKFIRLNRIHLEEDAGKLIHTFSGAEIDYNRGGLALIESVTEPDISSAEEAIEFLTKLRDLFVFSDVAKCRMEKGEMRCDVNLSIKEKENPVLGKRTEMKNLNSFKSVARAIEFETKRQIDILNSGGKIVQETRRWDDEKGESYSMRTKGDSTDYRYFPDPDILQVNISREIVEKLRKKIPLMPEERKIKYVEELNLPEYDAQILTSSKKLSHFFEECLSYLNEPKEISNWIMTEIMKLTVGDIIPITAKYLTDIIRLLLKGKITRSNSKQLLYEVCQTKEDPAVVAKKLGMTESVSDREIVLIVERILDKNPKALQQYAENPDKIVQFFTGGVMKETRGKADPTLTKKIIFDSILKRI